MTSIKIQPVLQREWCNGRASDLNTVGREFESRDIAKLMETYFRNEIFHFSDYSVSKFHNFFLLFVKVLIIGLQIFFKNFH